jgi:hypothetical protein
VGLFREGPQRASPTSAFSRSCTRPTTNDDPFDEATWRRLVQPEALRSEAIKARASRALKAAFLTRYLSVWVGADRALFDLAYWDLTRRCASRKFEGPPGFAAIDMAVRVDLAAASLIPSASARCRAVPTRSSYDDGPP